MDSRLFDDHSPDGDLRLFFPQQSGDGVALLSFWDIDLVDPAKTYRLCLPHQTLHLRDGPGSPGGDSHRPDGCANHLPALIGLLGVLLLRALGV